MEPQLAVGAWMPMPRKLRDASYMMALGIPNVTRTITVEMLLGIKCLVIILKSEAPLALAASTYSFPFSWSTAPRISRAVRTQVRRPRAIKMFLMPGPRTNMIPMAKIRSGNAAKISMIREIRVSTQPP